MLFRSIQAALRGQPFVGKNAYTPSPRARKVYMKVPYHDRYYGARKLKEIRQEEQQRLKVMFQGDFSKGVMCQEYVSNFEVDFHGVMIDEERIIGLRVRDNLKWLSQLKGSHSVIQHDENTGAIVELEVLQF